MDFDDVITAIDEDEVLQPGQLYFLFPLSRLNQPLRADEMAALAVKASSAIMKSGGAGGDYKYISRRRMIVGPGDDDNCTSCRTVSKIGRRSGGGGGGGGRWVKSPAKLSTIQE